jgi:hypothetical protein
MELSPRPPPTSLGPTDDHLTPTAVRTRRVIERKPPTDLLVSLTSLYFHHIHPWFPFLDPRRIIGDFGFAIEGSLIHHALFGISLPFSYDSRLDTSSSDSFWKYSKRRILLEVLEEPSYNSLEALIVLALDLSGMTNGAQVWGPLTIATRLAVQLQTAGPRSFRTSAELDSDTVASDQDQLCKNRLFWAIYALDCYVSITTCHHTQLLDQNIEHFKPGRTLTWQTPGATFPESHQAAISIDPQYVFSHHLQTLDYSRSVHRIYVHFTSLSEPNAVDAWVHTVLECSAELFEWSANLPRMLQLNAILESSVAPRCLPSLMLLHAYWCALIIHLHGLLICPTLPESPQLREIQSQGHEHCMRAVEDLTSIVSHIQNATLEQVGWPFAWCLWVALRYLLIYQYHAVMQVPPDTWDILLRHLQATGRYWQISNKYWRMLDQAMSELQQSAAATSPRPARFLPSIVDLRISTADLEDRFRVDPVLHQRVDAPEQAIPNAAVPFAYQDLNSRTIGDSLPMGTPMHATSVLPDSGTWYNMPLYATSAYQQSSQPVFDSTVEYM